MTSSVVVSHDPRPARRATIAEWLAEPDEKGAELIRGRIVYKALPSPEHGFVQGNVRELLGPFQGRPGGADRPGGWWISIDADLELGPDGVRPDLVGWRRDRVPTLPKARPGGATTERPDWVAEVLSPSTASRDLGDKLAIYHAAEIPHYWIIDPFNRTLTVYRRTQEGYVVVLGAGVGQTVRAEPFEGLELQVGVLFGDEADPEPVAAGR